VTSITGAIAALTGEETIRVLADTADYQNRSPSPSAPWSSWPCRPR